MPVCVSIILEVAIREPRHPFSMTRHSGDAGTQLIDATIAAVARDGLGGFSLRSVTAAIDRSTATVFHHFGSKDGLLVAATETALARDTAFHDTLASDLGSVRLNAANAADCVARYIGLRADASNAVARFWWEITFNADRWPNAAQAKARHYAMQKAFWRRLLDPLRGSEALSAFITATVAMESVYASVLCGRADYDLLLRETIRQAFVCDDPIVEGVSHWLSRSAPPPGPRIVAGEEMPAKLVESAAREILLNGVAALNHRRLTALVGASPSMIIYHFGDTERFAEQAIWAALLKNLPSALDPKAPAVETPQDVAAWHDRLLQMLPSDGNDAFYFGYARIVGQTCLLAKDHPAFAPLVHHLRILEGGGIHYASRALWPTAFALTRAQAATFAIWIKGFALAGDATNDAARRARLAQAVGIVRGMPAHNTERAL